MLITLESVRKVYGEGPEERKRPNGRAGTCRVEAVRGISLQVAEGEFVAIVGPSGSGKTTLLDIIGCLSRPTAGRYLLDGQAVGDLTDEALARLRNEKIGFIFQMFHLLPRHTALQNVALPLFYAGVARTEREARALTALRMVGLADRAHHWPNQLSGGQQQRAAVARALVTNPRLVLADEPTGNVDTQAGREILAILEMLHRQGRTVVLVTHDRDLVASTERIIFVRDGVILRDERTTLAAAEQI